ncbi:hypothetical protein B0T18DRAFT_481088 [Schizothecium vesticola]|uniref:Uncharacterized protein n=1 Tax=Schizothecium vesticola TaxID=314040 RepID=A0AA40K5Q9_9PEZI|nr:hypothetical protein B0T18DRAFT_481088 [Schizothecium vesticola]
MSLLASTWPGHGFALMGFTLARFMYLDIDNIFCGAAAFLVVFQSVPAIRHKFILAHRVNGYIILLLSVAGTAGALIVTRRAFGGGLDTQTGFGMIAVMFLRLRIEQHRAWMLRAWFYAGAIITVRPILFITALITSSQGTYHEAIPCSVIEFLNSAGQVNDTFSTCTSPDAWTVVRADINDSASPIGTAASLRAGFGMAGWLALALHAIGVEICIHLTPAEGERLRKVSHQRQLEAGMRKPGCDGLATDRPAELY